MKKIIITSLLIALLMPSASAHAAAKSLNTKGNKASCKNIKEKYKSEIMSKWSSGLSSDQDVLEEIDLNIKMLIERQKPTSGKIKSIIGAWIETEKNTKNALADRNVKDLTAAMNTKIKIITEFQKLCKLGI